MIDVSDFTRLTDAEWRERSEVERGIFIAEGLTTIVRALDSGAELRGVLTTDRWLPDLLEAGISRDVVELVDEAHMEGITGYHVHRGALAAFQRPLPQDPAHLLATSRRLVVVEDIVDHANIGAIIRSVAAFDIDALLLTPRCADPLYRRAIKVSMGNVFKIRWGRLPWPEGLQSLHESGYISIALTPDPGAVGIREAAADIRDARFAILLGTEGDGLHPKTIRDARMSVRIPMHHGVDSLNVAAAAAVVCYELTR